MLRSSGRKPASRVQTAGEEVGAGDWLTVREASEITGVPVSTIRKWARHDNIPSFLEDTADGYLRLVSMRGIERWTSEIGREIDPSRSPEDPEVDLTAADTPAADTGGGGVPEGSMIIPLDAWNRMLNQLGNLHEAGQQLAEARERAAKAETEAHFLKERLADLRDELERSSKTSSDTPARDPDEARETTGVSPTSIIRKAYDGWLSRRRR